MTLWSVAQKGGASCEPVRGARRGPLAAALATAILVAGLALAAVAALAPATASARSGERTLTVMTFNIWYGGVQVDFDQIAAAIRAADADIVGVQEPEGNLARLAAASDLPYYDETLHLLSRYPLFAVRRGGVRLAYAALDLNSVVAIGNLHLTCCPYGPEDAAAGKSAAKVLALERSLRLPEIRPWLRPLARLGQAGTPTFLTGDFNSPSHLDWTPAAAQAFPARIRYPLAWPVSSALARAGIRDSYREAHPDPVAVPGLTWTAGTPPPRIRPKETLDRIDWVLTTGPTTTLASNVVGEIGGPDVGIGVSPWGSDHRAVASTFRVTPGRAPQLVSAWPRVVERGKRVTLRYTSMTPNGRKVAILGRRSNTPLATLPIYDASDHIATYFGTRALRAGGYRAGLLDRRGRVLATQRFWIVRPGTRPSVRVAHRRVRPGAPIRVRFRGAPGDKLDWIGISRASEPDLYNYIGFKYTGARPSGSLTFTKADLGKLAPGRYVAGLFLDDGYSVLARTSFVVSRRR